MDHLHTRWGAHQGSWHLPRLYSYSDYIALPCKRPRFSFNSYLCAWYNIIWHDSMWQTLQLKSMHKNNSEVLKLKRPNLGLGEIVQWTGCYTWSAWTSSLTPSMVLWAPPELISEHRIRDKHPKRGLLGVAQYPPNPQTYNCSTLFIFLLTPT